ncbi:restriction endonuclease subunit S [Campylobacter upsaliensis]|nr:restriction endonuclease subunit S [Campylobacter upsaliensis]
MKKHTQSPYESSKVSYKPSGIEWLGEIPQSWEIRRLKYLFYISKEESRDEFPNVLSLTQNGIIERDITTNKGQLAQNYIGYNIVKRGDIILNPMDLSSGYVAKSTFEGVISQAYIKIRPLETLNLSYYESFFQNLYHYKILWHLGKGISYDHRWTLGNDVFLNIKIPLPPLQEQKEIAEFLDSKCEKIQNYIDKKQKLITLLQEKKQALINEAATKGLNPNIESKNSDIEYLGLIPHHWEVTNLKNIVSIKSGGTPSRDNKDYWNGDIPWIRSEFCHNQHIFQCDVKEKITTLGLQKSSAKMCKKNTILIALVGATIGQVAFLNFKSAINQNIAAIYPNNAAILDNVFLFFVALTFKQRFEILGKYAIANLAFIGNLKIPLPPLHEQKEIAAFLDSKVAQIDSVIEKTKKQIELIKEYKNTLINEAVCGRINFLEGILNE